MRPTLRKITAQQQFNGLVPVGIRIIGLVRYGSVVAFYGLGAALEFLQRKAPVIQGMGPTGLQRNRSVVTCEGRFKPP